jgi:hypothetical protein
MTGGGWKRAISACGHLADGYEDEHGRKPQDDEDHSQEHRYRLVLR